MANHDGGLVVVNWYLISFCEDLLVCLVVPWTNHEQSGGWNLIQQPDLLQREVAALGSVGMSTSLCNKQQLHSTNLINGIHNTHNLEGGGG